MAAEKKSRKVIDAVHPGDTPPTPTSRPIVGDRLYVASDPMLNESTSDDISDKPSGEASTVNKDAAAKEPPVSREAKDIAPIDDASQSTAKDTQHETVESDADAKDETNDTTKERVSSAGPEKPDTSEKSDAPEPVDAAAVTDSESDDSSDTPAPTPEDEATAARDAELERHIAAGTYAVPIGQVKQRQRKMMVISIVVLILAVVVFDVLLDLEILKLSSVPHTDFL